MKTQLNETGQYFAHLILLWGLRSKRLLFDTLQPAVFIDSIGYKKKKKKALAYLRA
jgi:hypothetical protein